MTAFEDFVNLELPRRTVMFTQAILGVTGDPNTIGNATLDASPAGTFYLDDATSFLWKKAVSGLDGWVPVPISQTNTLWVDPFSDTPTALQNGDPGRRFTTLTQAINAVPKATTGAEMRNNFYIVPAPGQYDEALGVDVEGKRIMIMSMGAWTLGTYEGSSWNQNGTRRNIRLFGNSASIDSIRPVFGISVMNDASRNQTEREWMLPRISGQFLQEANGGSMSIHIEAEILGDTGDSTGVAISDALGSTNSTAWTFGQSRIRGKVELANGQLNVDESRFDGDIIQTGSSGYNLLRNADIRANFQSSFMPSAERPSGIFDSELRGDLTAITPGDLFLLDSSTAAKFTEDGGALQNGALIEFQFSGSTILFSGGADQTITGQFYQVNGTSKGTASGLVIAAATRTSSITRLSVLTWSTLSANATTVLNIRVGGVVVEAVTLTGATGRAVLNQTKVAAGVDMAVEYASGTAPGEGTVKVYGQ